uniref:Ig-like domain-containing protein n=1 Tax=Anabas testudineus TaxID=64144 RepID=A0A3Q1ILK5_ANATE
MMLSHSNRKPLISCLGAIRVLVFHLSLTQVCRGQSHLIGPSQPIVAELGDDIILPCQLNPAEDAAGMTLEWTRPDLNPRFVHVWRSGQVLDGKTHKSFEGRTSLFINELKDGNISLKLSNVKLSDHGTYRCFIPAQDKQMFVELVTVSGAVSSPLLTLVGLDQATSGVVLQCESKGWYPEPELLWLDAEGKILSAGPTETVRGPDDLYTVSSRLTVEKRHSNNITCRVQQKKSNQIRETQIHVPDDFFNIQSSFCAVTVGLTVTLAVCILFISLLVFFMWKKNMMKPKRRQWDESDKGEKQSLTKIKNKDQVFTEEEREKEQLMTREKITVKTKHIQQKQTELQQLQEKIQSTQQNLQTLNEKLENKKKELEKPTSLLSNWFSSSQKAEAEREVEMLKKELETTETELKTKINESEDKQAEIQQLEVEIQRMETNNTEMKNVQQSADKRSECTQNQLKTENEELIQIKRHVNQLMAEVQKLNEEKQRSEDQRQQLEKELETKKQELQEIKRRLPDSHQTENTSSNCPSSVNKNPSERPEQQGTNSGSPEPKC